MTGQQPALTGMKVTGPGVYQLTADQYHKDPVPGGSLSSTGARKLLDPSCPALFRYWADHPEEHRRVWDFGSAAHAELLGIGREIRVIDADNYRTKAAQQEAAEAHEAGEIPMLTDEMRVVEDMIEALRSHPIASALFDPASGYPEQTIVWADRATGVNRRAMLDWLPDRGDGRLIVPDYKTTATSLDLDTLRKTMHRFALHQQAAWYLDAVGAAGLTGDLDPAFCFVFQSKTAPYLVRVVQVDPHSLMWGEVLNREAISTYAHCTRTGHWPGFDDVRSIDLPGYAVRLLEDAQEAGELTHYTDRIRERPAA